MYWKDKSWRKGIKNTGGVVCMKLKMYLLLIISFFLVPVAFADEIHQAVRERNIPRVRFILDNEPKLVNAKDEKYKETPLHIAVLNDDVKMAQFLLRRGALVNAKTALGWTPLHLVRSAKMAALLLKHGADISARDKEGYTPLHTAAMQSKEIVELLIKKGANVNTRGKDGKTPLDIAKEYMQMDIVELLLKHGGKE